MLLCDQTVVSPGSPKHTKIIADDLSIAEGSKV